MCVVQFNKGFRHVETLFFQGRNLYLAGLLLVMQGLFTFRQPIAGLQVTSFYLGGTKCLHVERPYSVYRTENQQCTLPFERSIQTWVDLPEAEYPQQAQTCRGSHTSQG